jgi:hypothetical protein
VLTSAEKSIRDMAAAVKIERQHGETLRLIDVPATLDGLDHIFDRRPSDAPTQGFNRWRDRTFANIVADCRANHGAALRAYIKKIVTAEFDVAAAAQEASAYFVQHVCDTADDVVARDVAGKFGIICAGGLLGVRLGIVPWTKDELLDAIGKCYRAARNLLPDEGVALRQGLAILEARLKKLDRSKKLKRKQVTSSDWDKLDGYRRLLSKKHQYFIRREVFNALFATAAQRNLVLNHLIESGRITMAVAKGGDASAMGKPQDQFIWPDGGRRRSYEIVFPRG